MDTLKSLPANAAKPFAFRSARGDPFSRLSRAASEHGDVVQFREGWLFSHPDAVRDILVTNDRHLNKSPALRWAKLALGNGLLTSEGELHQRQRRLIQPSLHPSRLAGYAAMMTRHAAEAAACWRNGQVISLHREMMRLTLRIVAEALFGADVGPEVDIISDAMDRNIKMFQRMISPWGPLKALLPTPFNIGCFFSRRRLVNTLRRFISIRRKSGGVHGDLLSRLLAAQDTEGGMSEQQLVDECVTLFTAGHETTANTLTYTLWLLSQNSAVEQKLHEEVDRVLGARSLPSFSDLESLTYTRMVVAESMRLYPPAWLMGRQVVETCAVTGYSVPQGTVILLSQWVTHRDPRWWPEPDRFIPERFAPDSSHGRHRWAYFPFGGGSRQCVGEAFAWAESTLVLASLVRFWRMDSLASALPKLEPGITLRPSHEIQMRLCERHPTSAIPGTRKFAVTR